MRSTAGPGSRCSSLASGFCALVYQTAWLRMFRLIFGASTAASAAVLAIFMGGLGLRRAAARPAGRPSACAARASTRTLEAGIALTPALSPWLLAAGASGSTSASGGSARLGLRGRHRRAPAARHPGAGRSHLPHGRHAAGRGPGGRARRRRAAAGCVGLLYAVNTLGAVVGALLTTFFSLEVLGIRRSIWIAALLNLLVGAGGAEPGAELAAGRRRIRSRRSPRRRRRMRMKSDESGAGARSRAGWWRWPRRWWASPSCSWSWSGTACWGRCSAAPRTPSA